MDHKLCCYGTYKNWVRCEDCPDDVMCQLEKRSRKEQEAEENGSD